MLVKEINLDNINSELINYLDEEDKNETKLHFNISNKLLNEFNERDINPANFNKIIEFCDYLLIENTSKFIITNSKPTDEEYVLSGKNEKNYRYDLGFLEKMTLDKSTSHDLLNWLKYFHKKGCPWDENTCSKTSKYGSLECLKYLNKNGCPWNDDTC